MVAALNGAPDAVDYKNHAVLVLPSAIMSCPSILNPRKWEDKILYDVKESCPCSKFKLTLPNLKNLLMPKLWQEHPKHKLIIIQIKRAALSSSLRINI
jgi:hypothetical protein